ncbi:tyrosine kinase [Medicago truncatula]|uniref:Tyrosine kinase n=1 Tax=Medicago truncatula TaxID=3880 RepID=G7I626_MEDTR|nr:tyrosine kinase [Medicago truncatula]
MLIYTNISPILHDTMHVGISASTDILAFLSRAQQSYKRFEGFKEKELFGTGGFGRKMNHESTQRPRVFVSEITNMGSLCHRSLVQLFGWCCRKGDLLVYDFMAKGSLDWLVGCDTLWSHETTAHAARLMEEVEGFEECVLMQVSEEEDDQRNQEERG